jgi:hypothetical protein
MMEDLAAPGLSHLASRVGTRHGPEYTHSPPGGTADGRGVALAGGAGRLGPPLRLERPELTPMSDNLPDRLSNDPRSPFYDAALLERGIGVRFNGADKHNVEEYCVSEGWIRVEAGNAKDRHGNPMTIKLKGEVEPYSHQPT